MKANPFQILLPRSQSSTFPSIPAVSSLRTRRCLLYRRQATKIEKSSTSVDFQGRNCYNRSGILDEMSSPFPEKSQTNDSIRLFKSVGDGSASAVVFKAEKSALPLETLEDSPVAGQCFRNDFLPPVGIDISGIPMECFDEETTWHDDPPLKKRQLEEFPISLEEIRLFINLQDETPEIPANPAGDNSGLEVKLEEEASGLTPGKLGDVHLDISVTSTKGKNCSVLMSPKDKGSSRHERPTGETSYVLASAKGEKYRVFENALNKNQWSNKKSELNLNIPGTECENSCALKVGVDRCAHFHENSDHCDGKDSGVPVEIPSESSNHEDDNSGILLDKEDENVAFVEKPKSETSGMQGTPEDGSTVIPNESAGILSETPGNSQDKSLLVHEDSENEDDDFAAAMRRELDDEEFGSSEKLEDENSVVMLGAGDEDSCIFIQFQDGRPTDVAGLLFRTSDSSAEGQDSSPWFPTFIQPERSAMPPEAHPENSADPLDFHLENVTDPSETQLESSSPPPQRQLERSADPLNAQPESFVHSLGTWPEECAVQVNTLNGGYRTPLDSKSGMSILNSKPGSSPTAQTIELHTSAAVLDTHPEFPAVPLHLHPESSAATLRIQPQGSCDAQPEFPAVPLHLHPESSAATLRIQPQGSCDTQPGASYDPVLAEGEAEGETSASETEEAAGLQGDRPNANAQSQSGWMRGAFRRLLITAMDEYFPYRLRHMEHPVVRAYSLLDTGLPRQAQQGEATLVPWCREVLAREGVDIDHVVQEGTLKGVYLLGVACQLGNCRVVTLLLDSGANVNPTSDTVGETPLHVAAFHGHRDVVALLLSRGARADDKCMSSFAALQLALENGHSDCALLLIEAGATIKLAPSFHGSPLPNLVLTLLLQVSTRALDTHHLLFRLYQRLYEPSFLVMPTLKTRRCNRSRVTIVDEVLRAGITPSNYKISDDDKDLLLLHSKGSRDIMYKLTCIGFNFYAQGWAQGLEEDLEDAGEFPEECQELLSLLRTTASSPLCLKQQCRLFIRQTLIQHRDRQIHLDGLIDTFPLPDFLKDFLKFKANGVPCFYVPD